jgi:hypothetical protein
MTKTAKVARETRYESLTEVHEIVDSVLQDRINSGATSTRNSGGEWTLGVDLPTAAHMLIHGWTMHHEEVHRSVETELDELRDRINKFNHEQTQSLLDVAGSWVDVDRFISGEPECMWEQQMNPAVVNGRVIRILINCTASHDVSDRALAARGSNVVAAVEAAQAMGFNAEIWVGEAVTPSSNRSSKAANVEIIRVKDYLDPIDIDSLMFCIAHPAMLRRIMFVLNEEHEEEHRTKFGFFVGGGYGVPTEFPESITESFDLVIERFKFGEEDDASKMLDSIFVLDENERISEYE